MINGCKTNRLVSHATQERSERKASFKAKQKQREKKRGQELAGANAVTAELGHKTMVAAGTAAESVMTVNTASEKRKTAEVETRLDVTTQYKGETEEAGRKAMRVETTKKRRVVTRKGQRQQPVPDDDHGCRHMGIHELKELPKKFLKTYVEPGNWLANKPCKDCASKPERETNRVLDVATILADNKANTDDMARICNWGPIGHAMGEDDEFKMGFTCDMILCKGCYNKRVEKCEEKKSCTNRRSSRNRS